MSYPNVANVTNSPQSFFLLGGRNREHMVTSSIVFLFPNLDNWPGCVALDLDRGAIDQDAAQSQRAGRANAIGAAISGCLAFQMLQMSIQKGVGNLVGHRPIQEPR